MDARKGKRLIGRLVTGIFFVGIAVAIGLGFQPEPIGVDVGTVAKRTLEVTVDEAGKTRVKARYTVSAPVTGSLARIELKAGDTVKAGDVIARISPMVPMLLDDRSRSEAHSRAAMAEANVQRMKATVQRGESALSFTKERAARVRGLHAGNATSQQALDDVEFAVRSSDEELSVARFAQRAADHELAMARAAIASMAGKSNQQGPVLEVTAPADGVVLRIYAPSEAVVQPGTPLLEVGDPAALEIVVDVLTTDAVRIAQGDVARIERWGGEGVLEARVRSKEPSAFTTRSALGVEEQRVPVLLDLVTDHGQWQNLGDGYRVETSIVIERVDQALALPASAVFRESDGWSTFVVEHNHAKKRTVTLGARTPEWIEIKGGLTEGTRVILYPSDRVTDGIEVDPT